MAVVAAASACAEFRRDLAKGEEMVRKVKLAIANVERNRVKFPHIDDRELGSRKAFVQGLDSVSGKAVLYQATAVRCLMAYNRHTLLPCVAHNLCLYCACVCVAVISHVRLPCACMRAGGGGHARGVPRAGDAGQDRRRP